MGEHAESTDRIVVSGGRQEPRRIHFGVGSVATANELRIDWPSGCVQTLHNVGTNQILKVVESCIMTVAIDIKPGSFPNSINIKSKGVIPVAVLSTTDFDASSVLAGSAGFGPAGALAVDVPADQDAG